MLIVQTDISADHRYIEMSTGVCQSLHTFLEHMISLWLVGISEIQVISNCQSSRSRACQVAHTFHKCDLSTCIRIEVAEAVITIIGNGEILIDPRNA